MKFQNIKVQKEPGKISHNYQTPFNEDPDHKSEFNISEGEMTNKKEKVIAHGTMTDEEFVTVLESRRSKDS